MRAFLCVGVLLCFGIVVAKAAKPGPALFADWFEQQQLSAAATTAVPNSAPAPAYEEAEIERGCLKLTSWGTCRCLGCTDYCRLRDTDGDGQWDDPAQQCTPLGPGDQTTCCRTAYWEANFGCCDDKGYEGGGQDSGLQTPLSDLQIGSCEFTEFRFPSGQDIEVIKDQLYKYDTFVATCQVQHGGECGHPFCDSMVLTWQGTWYGMLATSTTNPPTQPPKDCAAWNIADTIGGRMAAPGGQRQQQGQKETRGDLPQGLRRALESFRARRGATAEVAYSRHEHDDRDDSYHREGAVKHYVSTVDLYSGPITISSRKYDVKYHTGYMELNFWYNTDFDGVVYAVEVTAAEAANYHRVTPNTFLLQLNKKERY